MLRFRFAEVLVAELCLNPGDLNYRIDVPRDEALSLIELKKWNQLWDKDQLHREMEVRLAYLSETPILICGWL